MSALLALELTMEPRLDLNSRLSFPHPRSAGLHINVWCCAQLAHHVHRRFRLVGQEYSASGGKAEGFNGTRLQYPMGWWTARKDVHSQHSLSAQLWNNSLWLGIAGGGGSKGI